MKLLITVIVVFIIIVYGYTFIHYKKKRRQSMDHVQEFHEKYKIKKSNINETSVIRKYKYKYKCRYQYISVN